MDGAEDSTGMIITFPVILFLLKLICIVL
jgi:hypothetical protein